MGLKSSSSLFPFPFPFFLRRDGSGRAGFQAISSGILITVDDPRLASSAMEQAQGMPLLSVEVSQPVVELCPALVLLCCRVCRMLMASA
eukprot:5891777-Heterocapsa_arctica.AAC.1